MDKKEKKIRKEVALIAAVQIVLIFYAQVAYDINSRLIDMVMFMSIYLLISMIMAFVDIDVRKGTTKWDEKNDDNDK